MCCFSGPVKFVAKTKIFARGLEGGRQALAYAMDVELDQELAMVLPLPVPPRSADDAVQFVDLSGYEKLFDDLANAFPAIMGPAPLARGFGAPQAMAQPKLVVHDVALFEASFVPTHGDFVRLDERFRLPDSFWSALPQYADWGFAVFRLKPKKGGLFGFGGAKRQSIHPMAFTFPRREPDALFFPTVHVHDGKVHRKAHFDHALYCQADGLLAATLGWVKSTSALGDFVDAARAEDLVDGAQGGFTAAMAGDLPNEDVWLRAPQGIAEADLRGGGQDWAYTVKTRYLHGVYMFDDDRFRRWRETAQTKLPEICCALRDGVRALATKHREDWKLAPLTEDMERYWLNGNTVWKGELFYASQRAVPGVRGKIVFTPFTDFVEQQEVVLGFRELPDDAKAFAIHQELCALLARI